MWSFWKESFYKRICKYLIQRYLGQYLEVKLTLEQLRLDFLNGTGNIRNVSLKCSALNELAEIHSIPIEFIEGHLDCISFQIPWRTLMQDSCEIEISGINMTIQPKKRKPTSSVFDSMWTSMASSTQLAADYLQTVDDEPVSGSPPLQSEDSGPISGLEQCAQTIDALFTRCRVSFRDVTIRVERVLSSEKSLGVAVEVKIKRMNYADEITVLAENQRNYNTAYSEKRIQLEGLSCFTDLFTNFSDMESSVKSTFDDSTAHNGTPDVPNAPILFCKFAGAHTVKVRLKDDDSISGPTLMVECNFGSLTAFMTPLQVHILYKIVDELINPECGSSMKADTNQFFKDKPMNSYDLRRVEAELQEQIKPGSIGLSGNRYQGWSSPRLDDSDEFLPMSSKTNGLFSSVHSTLMNVSTTSVASSIGESAESMYSGISSSTQLTSPDTWNRSRGMSVSQIQSTEKNFLVSLTNAVVVLLHDDILSLASPENSENFEKISRLSSNFFGKLGLSSAASGKRNVDSMRELLTNCCSLNHLRLIVAPIKVSATVSNASTAITTGLVTFGHSELSECLVNVNSKARIPELNVFPLLTFLHDQSSTLGAESSKIEFRYKEYSPRTTKTTLKIYIQPCNLEVDVSIVDRISSLLNPSLARYLHHFGMHEPWANPMEFKENVISVKIDIPSTSLKERFLRIQQRFLDCDLNNAILPWRIARIPVPDLRSDDDIGKVPYWIRNVRNDSIVFKLKGYKFSTVISSRVNVLKLDNICEEIQLYYKETQTDDAIFIGEATSFDEDLESMQMTRKGFDWPRIVVFIYPEKPPSCLSNIITSEDTDPTSLDAYFTPKQTECSPFTARRVVHECMTSVENESKSDNESVIPGDRSEMNSFIEKASENVVYKVEMRLRNVSLCLPSKHIFEELYNRLGSDLLLWEPSAHNGKIIFPDTPVFQHFNTTGSRNNDEVSGSEDEEEMSAFYVPNQGSSLPRKTEQKLGANQSLISIDIAIEKGICSFFTPFTNVNGGVVPEQKGQISLILNSGNFFVVSGYAGNSNIGYVCLYAKQAEFYHLDLLPGQLDALPKFGSHMRKTIFLREDTLSLANSNSSGADCSDMLSLAIKIEKTPTNNVKKFTIAASIHNGVLSHSICYPNRSWLTQLIEFFDVNDAPIHGYIPSAVVTELHLHLWNCAIDYSPLNLPLGVILTIEYFTLSSNIVAQTNISVISLLSEQAALYLSTTRDSIDLKTDYVCVLDMDLFELSLRLCQNRNSSAPRIELTASNNVLHIRTCSDSFRHLMDLITYYANDGDLNEGQVDSSVESGDCTPIPDDNNEPALIETVESGDAFRGITTSQTEQVHELVADAMAENRTSNESRRTSKASDFNGRRQLELHFETSGNGYGDKHQYAPGYYEPIMQSSDGLPVDINPSDDDCEEFCILENDPGVGILKSNGDPVARILIDEPIVVIDNHFTTPIARTDILKPPKHYPNAVMRYVIQDFGVIWHLYGGEDFPARNVNGKKISFDHGRLLDVEYGEIDIGLDALKSSVVFSKTRAFERAREAFENPNHRQSGHDRDRHLRNKGGAGRKLDVCIELHLAKMKFQHDTYPDQTEQASRHVLVIHSVEILDRLISSNYNKMLYLFSSTDRPKQSHANMVVIKAAHIRPDPQLGIEECCLKISVLPIRINVDQDALLFLYQFFGTITAKAEVEGDGERSKPQSHHSSLENLPVMCVKNCGEEDPGKNLSPELGNLLMFDEPLLQEDNISTSSKDPSIDSTKASYPIYFRQIIFSPEVPIRIDYTGKRLDMSHGPLAGLLMCLGQLNNSQIQLKTLNHRNGILGVDRLLLFMATEWGNDIKKNQLKSLLGGIGPLHSFVQIFQGVRDLFWLPIEQYQKDGRITKGLQRGASAFSTSTAMAVLELTNRLVQTIQNAAEFTYDMVSPGPSVQQQRRQSTRKRRAGKPGDIRDGVTNAYHVIKEGFGDTAKNFVRVATKEREQKGLSGAVGGVLRQIAPTVCVPIILSTQATSSVLDGVVSQLQPETKKDAAEKYKNF